jgi:hypothetical protein
MSTYIVPSINDTNLVHRHATCDQCVYLSVKGSQSALPTLIKHGFTEISGQYLGQGYIKFINSEVEGMDADWACKLLLEDLIPLGYTEVDLDFYPGDRASYLEACEKAKV